MKKTINLKSILLLCLLFIGLGGVQAEDIVYQWSKVTSLSEVQTGDNVVIVDESKKLALPNTGGDFTGVRVTISGDRIIGTPSTDIQWILSKNGSTFNFETADGNQLYGEYGPNLQRLTMNSGNYTTSDFYFDDYDSGGKLNYEDMGSGKWFYYVYWGDQNQAEITDSKTQAAKLTLYKKAEAPKVVKWKLVDGENVTFSDTDDDVVVIVDLNSGLAMSNDKDDKDPDAVAVTLNYDKDRLLDEVPDKVQWTLTRTDGYQFAVGDNKLYADSKGLKVGTATPNAFSIHATDGVNYMSISIDGNNYTAGVEESMFSSSWKLMEDKNGKPDDKVKDTRVAIFKKVESYQSIPTLSFPCDNYEVNMNEVISGNSRAYYDKATCDEGYDVKHYSSNVDIAYPQFGAMVGVSSTQLVMSKRGNIDLIARVEETADHDKAVAVCTVRINDSQADLGTKTNPLTPSQAISLAKGELNGMTFDPNRSYFIQGKVNKVNSGMLAMFGDMGLDEMLGDDMDMDEMMGDMDDFDMSEMGDMMGGMDITSMIPGFGGSDGLTYYISDDGTKDNRLKVVNGRGLVTLTSNGDSHYQQATFAKLKDLSPGDDVLVYGPLELSEDKNMFEGLMGNTGGNNTNPEESTEEEDKRTVKVGELNYLHNLTMTLLVQDQHMYENTTKNLTDNQDFFYTLNQTPEGTIQPAQVKSSDEEIAKWIKIDETNANSDSLFTAVKAGKAKITVKVKVIVTPAQGDEKEKSYTMKRKFQLEVRPRAKDPEGKNVGEYVLVENANELEDGTRLLIVGTRSKDDNDSNYAMSSNNSMMGGGKGGNTIDNDKITTNDEGRERILFEDVPDGTQEIILEKEGDIWYLNVGKDENGDKLYLYASLKAKEEGDDEGGGNTSGFNMDEMMEMFMPSSGLKVATKAAATSAQGVDSCQAVITIDNKIATIKFINVPDTEKNTIVLTSAFDMDSMMNMFGGNEESTDDDPQEEQSTSGMNFDFFMASFNTKKADDIDGEKAILPRIFGFVQYDEYPINIGNAEWMTIVSDYDVIPQDGVTAYVVTKVRRDDAQTKATLKPVASLKGGEPYLLHSTSGEYIMTRTADVPEPEVNLLLVSDDETIGEKGNTSVYVLANKSKGVGFYRWTGGKLGAGRVYLPVEASVAGTGDYCSFFEEVDETTAIEEIDRTEIPTGPYYDLQGRRVLKPMKGVYIMNGKKVVVK